MKFCLFIKIKFSVHAYFILVICMGVIHGKGNIEKCLFARLLEAPDKITRHFLAKIMIESKFFVLRPRAFLLAYL